MREPSHISGFHKGSPLYFKPLPFVPGTGVLLVCRPPVQCCLITDMCLTILAA